MCVIELFSCYAMAQPHQLKPIAAAFHIPRAWQLIRLLVCTYVVTYMHTWCTAHLYVDFHTCIAAVPPLPMIIILAGVCMMPMLGGAVPGALLSLLGFSAAGPVAGSYAAAWMSATATACKSRISASCIWASTSNGQMTTVYVTSDDTSTFTSSSW